MQMWPWFFYVIRAVTPVIDLCKITYLEKYPLSNWSSFGSELNYIFYMKLPMWEDVEGEKERAIQTPPED